MGLFKRYKTDSNKFPNNSDLINAINEVANNDNPKTRQILNKLILKSDFMIPTSAEKDFKKTQIKIAKKNKPVQILITKNPEEKSIIYAFTDNKSLLNWTPEGCNCYIFHSYDIFSFALYNNIESIVINPAGPIGGEISHDDIEMLAHGYINSPHSFDHSQVWMPGGVKYKVRMFNEKARPDLKNSLNRILRSYPNIVAGYLLEQVIEKSLPHLVLGVEFSEELSSQQLEEIMSNLIKEIEPLFKEKYVRLYVLKKGDTFINKNEMKPIFSRI